jgi:hypothetical protein
MSSKQEQPTAVKAVASALSKRLGRESCVRKVSNTDQWYIVDPVFSHIAKARNAYRAGFKYYLSDDSLGFSICHCPWAARLFKENMSQEIMDSVIAKAHKRCGKTYAYWSSRSQYKEGGDNVKEVDMFKAPNPATIDIKDLFWEVKGRPEIVKGNHFGLYIQPKVSQCTQSEIDHVLADFWPLFSALYPAQPKWRRAASLSRNLVTAKIAKTCEVEMISGLPALIRSIPCCDVIEAAHIKPHHLGGSDLAENGLWLCKDHHRRTEGKLRGKRPNIEYHEKTSPSRLRPLANERDQSQAMH